MPSLPTSQAPNGRIPFFTTLNPTDSKAIELHVNVTGIAWNAAAMVRVLLAVAHSSLRATLEECLAQEREMSCTTAATSEELWSRLSHDEWDVLVLDLRLPEQTKRATVHTLHERYPDLPILVLSLSLTVPFGRWQEAGGRGFLAKAKLSTELIEAVRVISRGGKYFPEDENDPEGEGEERKP